MLIVTALDEVYQLWLKFFINYGFGETIDPDTKFSFNVVTDLEAKIKAFCLESWFLQGNGWAREVWLAESGATSPQQNSQSGYGIPESEYEEANEQFFSLRVC